MVPNIGCKNIIIKDLVQIIYVLERCNISSQKFICCCTTILRFSKLFFSQTQTVLTLTQIHRMASTDSDLSEYVSDDNSSCDASSSDNDEDGILERSFNYNYFLPYKVDPFDVIPDACNNFAFYIHKQDFSSAFYWAKQINCLLDLKHTLRTPEKITLISLLYELIYIPEMEQPHLIFFIKLLIRLLKYRF